MTDRSVLTNERLNVPPFNSLEYRTADGLITIAVNRPPHNVLDIALMAELGRAIDGAARDESAKALIITAAGDKIFSADRRNPPSQGHAQIGWELS